MLHISGILKFVIAFVIPFLTFTKTVFFPCSSLPVTFCTSVNQEFGQDISFLFSFKLDSSES